MQILSPSDALTYFGLPDSAGNLERMEVVIGGVEQRLMAAYGDHLLQHQREDFFLVNSRVRPFNADALALKLHLPFVTDTESFEISHGPLCGWSDFNPCFSCCSGKALTNGDKVLLDECMGVVTVLCPCDKQLYRVRYQAGFPEVDGTIQLPSQLLAEIHPMIEVRWNALCEGEDDECKKCGTGDPAVLMRHQSNVLLYRFLPSAHSPIHSRVVPEEEAAPIEDATAMGDGT